MIRADKRKYHFIYRTTCLITNRYYIGMHSTENLEDGYIGSGKRLWNSIRKYGKENHTCEIVEFLPERKELVTREKQIVNEELLNDELCMNLRLGGEGGFDYLNKSLTPEQRTKSGLAGPYHNIGKYDDAWKDNLRTKRIQGIRKAYAEGKMPGFSKEAIVKGCLAANSEKSKQKRKETFIKIEHQQGEKNSSFGTCWIYHNLIGSRKCKKDLLPEYIEQGWIKGRKMNTGELT